jgi:hypothetical protein
VDVAMMRPISICAVAFAASLAAIAMPVQSAELSRTAHARHVVHAPVLVYGPAEPFCSWCIRDAIYANTRLIAHLEANPDVDEAFKGPIVLNARADIHYWRWLLGPGVRISAAPCCYSRKRIYVR